MGEIEVEGLGVVEIAGDKPTTAETAKIRRAMQSRVQPQASPTRPDLPAFPIGWEKVEQARAQMKQQLGKMGGAFRPGQQDLRNALTAGGAIGLPMLGAAINPAIGLPALGLLGGGGAILGGATSELAGLDPSASTGEAYGRLAREAALDVGTFGMASRAGPAVRMIRRRITNVNEAVAGIAERYGVRLAPEDVSGNRSISGIRNVVGKFPVFTGKFARASKRKAADLDRALIDMVDDISPTASALSDPKLGEEIIRFSKDERYETFTEINNALWRRFRKTARREKALIPTSLTRARFREIIEGQLRLERAEEFVREVPTGLGAKTVTPATQKVTERVRKVSRLPVEKSVVFARKVLEGLPDEIDIRTYDKLARRLNKQIKEWRKLGLTEDANQLWAAKNALENDLLNVQGAGESERLVKMARSFFNNGRKPFETAQAQMFGRVDKNVFTFGFEEPGRKEADAFLLDVLNEIVSPQSVKNLRFLVGEQNMNRVARRYLERRILDTSALEISPETGRVALNLNAVRKNLGLGNPGSQAYETTKELLAGTRVRIDDLEDFFELAETAMRSPVVDFSQFIARRTVLGGARSGVKGLMPMLSDEKVPISRKLLQATVALFTVFRISDIVTNPAALKLARKAIHPTTEEAIRVGALTRIGQMIPERSESEITGLLGVGAMGAMALGGRAPGLGRGAAVTRRLLRNPLEAGGFAGLRQLADRAAQTEALQGRAQSGPFSLNPRLFEQKPPPNLGILGRRRQQ